MRRLPQLAALSIAGLLTMAAATAQQVADPDFRPSVRTPAWVNTHPLVVLDEAHANFHTASGRYKPFADLLRADGYRVVAGTGTFTGRSLGEARVLVVANAGAGPNVAPPNQPPSAFTDPECDAARDWVRGGGSLLLIADHAPFGAAAAALAARFGVEMGKGYAWSLSDDTSGDPSTTIVYSRGNGLHDSHPIARGVDRVVTFTGQSLGVPPGAVALLTFGRRAYESAAADDVPADIAAFRAGKTIAARNISGRAQGIASDFGKGRVVVMGEAAMFSAQVGRYKDEQGREVEFRMGMNVPGSDNQRFLLNVMRWLTRLD